MRRSAPIAAAALAVVLPSCTERLMGGAASQGEDGTVGGATDGAGTADGPTASAGLSEGSGDAADETGGPSDQDPEWITPDSDLDILVVLDDSITMGEEQPLLVEAIAALTEVLERPEVNASYRIAVTTTDDGNPWCGGSPEAGRFVASSCRGRAQDFVVAGIDMAQEACLDLCPAEEIALAPTVVAGDPEPRPRPWIERIDGATNLPAGLSTSEALGCLIPQGIAGCGFEQPLEAMKKALDRARTPGESEYGFLRDGARLVVVFVTDEADGSMNDAFDTIWLPEGDRVFWSDPSAPAPTSAVVWNAGVACSGASPYSECHAVDLDASGDSVPPGEAQALAVLHPVQQYIDELQAIEDAKKAIAPDREVLVTVIAGAMVDGTVVYADSPNPVEQSDFGIGPGCEGPRGRATPPVRLRELAEAFAVAGAQNLFSICSESFSGALEPVASGFAGQVMPMCLPGCAADLDPTKPGLDHACTLWQEEPQSDGTIVTTEIPPCTEGGALPSDAAEVCWIALTGDSQSDFCKEAGANLEIALVRRAGEPANGGTAVSAHCELDPQCPLSG